MGDSRKGLVFARGVTVAFLEAAKLVEATNDFYNSKVEVISGQVPESFKRYETSVFKIYQSEKRWAIFKSSGLKIFRTVLRSIVKPVKWVLTPFTMLYTYFRNKFFKRLTLGELIEKLEGGTPKPDEK